MEVADQSRDELFLFWGRTGNAISNMVRCRLTRNTKVINSSACRAIRRFRADLPRNGLRRFPALWGRPLHGSRRCGLADRYPRRAGLACHASPGLGPRQLGRNQGKQSAPLCSSPRDSMRPLSWRGAPLEFFLFFSFFSETFCGLSNSLVGISEGSKVTGMENRMERTARTTGCTIFRDWAFCNLGLDQGRRSHGYLRRSWTRDEIDCTSSRSSQDLKGSKTGFPDSRSAGMERETYPMSIGFPAA